MAYTVYIEAVSGRDNDKGFDKLADAEMAFDDAVNDSHSAYVELIDNSGDEPKVLANWHAGEKATRFRHVG